MHESGPKTSETGLIFERMPASFDKQDRLDPIIRFERGKALILAAPLAHGSTRTCTGVCAHNKSRQPISSTSSVVATSRDTSRDR